MQRAQEAAGPSRPTQTITVAPTPEERAGTLRLRGHNTDTRRVAWTQNTVDNEHLGRKSSKICCIYHKPKDFDESSSESSESDSQDTGDEHDVAAQKLKRKIQEKKRRKDDACCEHGHGNSSSEEKHDDGATSRAHNAYEKGVK